MADEELQEFEEKQEPDRPHKKKSEMKLPVLLGIIFGVVIIFIAATYFLFIPKIGEMLNPNLQTEQTEDEDKDKEEKEDKKKDDEDREMTEDEILEEEFMTDEKDIKFMETGRITTNPKASSKFIVINLGLEFKYKLGEDEEAPADPTAIIDARVLAKLRGAANNILGSMTEDELHTKRDSLSTFFKHDMRPILMKKKIFLRDVILQEFIIQ